MGVNCGFVLVAALLVVYVSPVAAGSGIPQIKCYLNGVKVPKVSYANVHTRQLSGTSFRMYAYRMTRIGAVRLGFIGSSVPSWAGRATQDAVHESHRCHLFRRWWPGRGKGGSDDSLRFVYRVNGMIWQPFFGELTFVISRHLPGAVIAAGISQGRSTTLKKDFKILEFFRSVGSLIYWSILIAPSDFFSFLSFQYSLHDLETTTKSAISFPVALLRACQQPLVLPSAAFFFRSKRGLPSGIKD